MSVVARSVTLVGVMFVVALAGCGSPAAGAPVATPAAHEHQHEHGQGHVAKDDLGRALDEVAAIHGAPGPWAVAGYRMSEHALATLGLPRGSMSLEVVHWTPREVRYACIADGAAAHSGASMGKLNLSLVEASADNVLTIYRDKKSGKTVALRPTASFRTRYAETPRDKARELGREVLTLPADQVFEEISVK